MSKVLRAVALAGTVAAAAARAAEPESDWEVHGTLPVGTMTGHTTYRISASDGVSSVASELEFPLQGVLAGVSLRAASPASEDGARWTLEGTLLHTITELSGTMKDSDWLDGPAETAPPPNGAGAPHPGKDIFSTSTAFLSALVLEGRVGRQFPVTPALRLSPVVGFLYQSFSYDVRDVVQVGYGPWAPISTGNVSGRVLTYDVSYRAPYVGGRADWTSGSVAVSLDAWVSPFASAEDVDNHLLRFKRSTTSADGTAWQARLEGRFALGAEDALALQGSAVGFSATGPQTQTFYAGPNAGLTGSIDARITSLRLAALVAWTHRL
jgi:outer membrane protease